MKTVSITNQKGGVGKTTTSVNLAAAVADRPRRVLLIDLDPQGNATTGSGVDKRAVELSSAEVLMKDALAGEAIVHQCKGGYDLMPGNEQLTTAEVRLLELQGREFRLREALQPLQEKYDYVFV
ncbi:MAG: AAA family ATPase, partial [Gammaproteobacteria bacterium]|nr:AAA family ATPase [Gammaproteobacteria bacterium]